MGQCDVLDLKKPRSSSLSCFPVGLRSLSIIAASSLRREAISLGKLINFGERGARSAGELYWWWLVEELGANVWGKETSRYLDAADPLPNANAGACGITRVVSLVSWHAMCDGLVSSNALRLATVG